MSKKTARFIKGWMSLFLGLWLISYIIYPSWALPISAGRRFFVYLLLFVYFALNGIFLRKWMQSSRGEFVPAAGFKQDFKWTTEYRWLLLLLSVFIILHIYPLSFSGFAYPGDGAYHATIPLTLNEVASLITQRFIGMSFLSLIRIFSLSLLISWFLRKPLRKFFSSIRNLLGKNPIHKFLLWPIICLIAFGYFWFLRDLHFMQGLIRYPPLGKILYLFAYSIFGIHEFTPRMVQLIFAVFAAVYIFRIGKMYIDKETALYASAFLLFFPNFFYWAGTASLTSGVTFFIASISFYFLRSLKTASFNDRLICIFLVGMGFLYYRMLLLMIPIFWIALPWGRSGENKLYTFKEKLKLSWFCAAPMIPWLSINCLYPEKCNMNMFESVSYNWLHPHIAMKYLLQMPRQIGYIFFLMFVATLIFLISRRKIDFLNRYLFSWIGIYYIFITSHWATLRYAQGVSRWSTYFYPAVGLIIAQIYKQAIGKARVRNSLFVLLLLYLALSSTVLALPPIESRYVTYRNSTSNPDSAYDVALKFIKENLSEDSFIFTPAGSNYFKFYIYKHNTQPRWSSKEGIDYKKIRNFAEYCRIEGINYVLQSGGDLNEDEFELTKDFTSGTNRLYLWRVVSKR